MDAGDMTGAIASVLSDLSKAEPPLGKKAAGRLLDDVEHNGMPEVRA